MLLADAGILFLLGKLWLDGVNVRLMDPRETFFDVMFSVNGGNAEFWMTNVTLQGNVNREPPGVSIGGCIVCGMDVVSNAAVYAEGAIRIFHLVYLFFFCMCTF